MRTALARLGGCRLEVLPSRRGLGLDGLPHRYLAPAQGSYEEVLTAIQRLRGSIYVQSGAIPVDALDEVGRHRSVVDEESWHLYILGPAGQLLGCVRQKFYAGMPRL